MPAVTCTCAVDIAVGLGRARPSTARGVRSRAAAAASTDTVMALPRAAHTVRADGSARSADPGADDLRATGPDRHRHGVPRLTHWPSRQRAVTPARQMVEL